MRAGCRAGGSPKTGHAKAKRPTSCQPGHGLNPPAGLVGPDSSWNPYLAVQRDESMTADQSAPLILTVPAEAAGARLDKWLADAGTGMSRSRLRVLIEEAESRQRPASTTQRRSPRRSRHQPATPGRPAGAEESPSMFRRQAHHRHRQTGRPRRPPGRRLGTRHARQRLASPLRQGSHRHRRRRPPRHRPPSRQDTSGVMVAAKSEAAHTAHQHVCRA
jgi:hypothetical protein